MFAPVFKLAAASAEMTALVGTSPVRVWPAGGVPATPTAPYIVFQTIGGEPENYIGDRPDMDDYTTQIDVYASTRAQAAQVARAMRDVLEQGGGYITRWGGEFNDAATKLYRYSFDIDFSVPR